MSASPEDLDAILPRLHSDPDRQRVLAAVVQIQRLTGMRPGELLELRPEDLDCSRVPWRYVPASGGKTYHLDKARKVFIGVRAREILLPFLQATEAGQLVFRTRRRNGRGDVTISIAYYRQCLADACREACVPVIRPNQIRHTRATELDELGETSEAIAASLGNTREVVERVYIDSHGTREAKRIAEQHG